MNQIKFSHIYPKLWGQKKAKLLDVRIVSFFSLHSDLLNYDTRWNDGNEVGKYPLPHDNLIHLTFLGENLIPFCTIRRHTNQKYSYYKSKIGEEFEVVLTSTKPSAEGIIIADKQKYN